MELSLEKIINKDNRKKIFLIFLLFVFCLSFITFYSKKEKPKAYKIIRIVEADEFYIDLNNNNIPEDNELFKLKNIIALRPSKNNATLNHAKSIKINIETYLKVGYLAREYAKETFLDKEVIFLSNIEEFDKKKGYREADLEFYNKKTKDRQINKDKENNKNLAIILLKQGLATVNIQEYDYNYYRIQNINQIKLNNSNLNKISFILVNSKNNIAHFLDCPWGRKVQNGKVVLFKDLKNHVPCKVCIKGNSYKEGLFNNFYDNLDLELLNYKIPKNEKRYNSSLYRKFNSLELFVENPYLIKKPQDSCKTKVCTRLLEEINNSRETIDIAIYGFGYQSAIFNSLQKAKQRGVKIRAVVDYSKNLDTIYPNCRKFIEEFNAITDKSEILMHNKFIIFDNSKVFTGSYNLSETGTGGYNLNSGVLINSKELANQYREEFEQMFNQKFSSKKEKVETHKIKIEDITITNYFLPKNNGYKEGILPLIVNAKEEILVSAFYLTEKNLINELINAYNRGVNIIILLDALSASNFKDRTQILRKTGIPVKIENWGGKNHEKALLIDSKFLIIGSNNFSASGFYKNDENFLIIENIELGKIYRDFYLYLFNSIDNKFLKLYPKAEGLDSINSCTDGIDNDYDGKIDKDDEGCQLNSKRAANKSNR